MLQLFAFLWAVFAWAGCVAQKPPAVAPEQPPRALHLTAQLSPTYLEAAQIHVVVYQVAEGGQLKPLFEGLLGPEALSSQGLLTLTVAEPPEHDQAFPQTVLLRVDTDYGYGLAVAKADVSSAQNVVVQQVDDASTVSAHLYLAAVAEGHWPQAVNPAALTGLVGLRFSQQILSQPAIGTVFKLVSRASSACLSSWRQVLQGPGVGLSLAQMQLLEGALQLAEVPANGAVAPSQAAQSLGSLVSPLSERSQFDAAMPLAYAAASLRPEQLGAAAQAAVLAYEIYAQSLEQDGAAEAWVRMERLRAQYVVDVVRHALGTLSRPQARTEAQTAAEALEQALLGARGDLRMVQALSAQSWAHYAEAVEPLLWAAAPAIEHEAATLQAAWPEASAAIDTLAAARRDLRPDEAPQKVIATAVSQAQSALQLATELTAEAEASQAPAAHQTLLRTLVGALVQVRLASASALALKA